ncbi:hypothetical protein [Paraburkholderia sp. HD33-4]|uniref:hypothetical protein n=1 Tax=Paraburkholderia sp. HD33-4 TaxID=2883242 RepID=UPI001F2E623D|nr:hypothetical protein [Paraburkholderia sp. HD33-4]
MNVHEYFVEKLGRDPMDDLMGDEMPVDSPCGADCASAIDAAAALVTHLRQGFGNDYPFLVDNVIFAANRVCQVYIYG